MGQVWNSVGSVIETLEGRTLMSGSTLAISEAVVGNGTELRVQGTAVNNKISLKQTAAGLVVSDNGFSQTVAGQFADIKVAGGAGNDSILVDASVTTNCFLYGGAGKNVLQAGSGNDTLVTIGSTSDTLVGGSGNDSFWADARPQEKIVNVRADEIAGGNVHRVGSFFGTTPLTTAAGRKASKAHAKAALIEPATTGNTTYQNFSGSPLFSSAGPSENDIYQGQIGDCFFLSVLSSVARTDAAKIEQSILQMNDGTYLVQFSKGSSTVYVHVDGELPVAASGQLEYAGLGTQGSTWVAIMEKAFAIFSGPTASYSSINGGWMDQSYAALGSPSTSYYGGSGATSLLSMIQADLAAGESVTYGTDAAIGNGIPLIGSHAYAVDSVNVDGHGVAVSLTLRNPWGIGANNGHVTVTAQQAYASMAGLVSAKV